MFLMYVDESGDSGKTNSPTKYYILSALVVHESNWQSLIDDTIHLKRIFKDRYGLLMKEEIHASEFLQKRIKLKNSISRNDRLDLLKKCLDYLNQRNDVSIITIRIDKSRRDNPFEFAWQLLIQRFENTLSYRNFPGPTIGNDKGIIVCDNTDGEKLRKLLRKMRRYNLVSHMMTYGTGNRNIPLKSIIEDPVLRDSKDSFILQIVDVIAYFAKQYFEPNKYVRKKGAKNFYLRLHNVINPHASRTNTPHKMVEY